MTLLEWRIANKVLLNYEFTQDDINKYRPNELNYDKTRVSFTKGCFRGQEIVARVHYLGVNRREFVTAIVDINSQDNSQLKIKGQILEHLDYKIFNASIKKDDVEKGIFNSLDLIRS
jgi:folate-binding protein YgfZ